MEHDHVARLDVSNGWPDLEDLPESLVSEQVRQKFIGPLDRIDLVDLCAADPAVPDADEHLTGGQGAVPFDLIDDERFAAPLEDGRTESQRSWHASTPVIPEIRSR